MCTVVYSAYVGNDCVYLWPLKTPWLMRWYLWIEINVWIWILTGLERVNQCWSSNIWSLFSAWITFVSNLITLNSFSNKLSLFITLGFWTYYSFHPKCLCSGFKIPLYLQNPNQIAISLWNISCTISFSVPPTFIIILSYCIVLIHLPKHTSHQSYGSWFCHAFSPQQRA